MIAAGGTSTRRTRTGHAADHRGAEEPPRARDGTIAARANVDLADNNGMTPLCMAAYTGHVEVVHLLVRAGADQPSEAASARRSTGSAKLGADKAEIKAILLSVAEVEIRVHGRERGQNALQGAPPTPGLVVPRRRPATAGLAAGRWARPLRSRSAPGAPACAGPAGGRRLMLAGAARAPRGRPAGPIAASLRAGGPAVDHPLARAAVGGPSPLAPRRRPAGRSPPCVERRGPTGAGRRGCRGRAALAAGAGRPRPRRRPARGVRRGGATRIASCSRSCATERLGGVDADGRAARASASSCLSERGGWGPRRRPRRAAAAPRRGGLGAHEVRGTAPTALAPAGSAQAAPWWRAAARARPRRRSAAARSRRGCRRSAAAASARQRSARGRRAPPRRRHRRGAAAAGGRARAASKKLAMP